ncbi:hypothetical protein KIPB_007098, partial [Kipferlia bialata]|eukprot:g7098.t1
MGEVDWLTYLNAAPFSL